MAGAKFLFGAEGLHPMYFGVSKEQLKSLREKVRVKMRKGEIIGQPDRSKERYYPQERFDDPAIGPNLS